jgi:phospholipid-translocating ATPase
VNDDGSTTYQASSPDEVAIVEWTESVGVKLISRDRTSMTVAFTGAPISPGLSGEKGREVVYDILSVFPFTSESKRMGIITRNRSTSEILFVQKGADTIMSKLVQRNDWLDEECGNMAREGLRTLVLGRKKMSEDAYRAFDKAYKAAQLAGSSADERAGIVGKVVSDHLEHQLELLALTGVEDKLQHDVKATLELIRNAGVKVWMLTGDKIETATNIAVASRLVGRGQYIHQVAKCKCHLLSGTDAGWAGVVARAERRGSYREAHTDDTVKTADQVRDVLDFLSAKLDACLVIDGESLQVSCFGCIDRHQLTLLAMSRQVPNRIRPPRYTITRRRRLSLFPHAKSRCRPAHTELYKEDGVLYRRWR